jgi:hypothetical protein
MCGEPHRTVLTLRLSENGRNQKGQESMSYRREYSVEGDVFCVELSGELPATALKRDDNLFEPLIQACRDRNLSKILIDARDVQTNLGFMDVFRAAKDLASLPPPQVQVACVVNPRQYDPLFEQVANTRGAMTRVFMNREDAFDWFEN